MVVYPTPKIVSSVLSSTYRLRFAFEYMTCVVSGLLIFKNVGSGTLKMVALKKLSRVMEKKKYEVENAKTLQAN